MSKIRSRLIIAGLVTLLVGLLVMFPARVAYQWLSPPGVALSGIEGSIWSGRASAAQVSRLFLHNLEWRMRPGALLTGRFGFRFTADAATGFVAGDVALGTGGSIGLSDFSASLSLQDLQEFIGMPGLSGMVNLQFSRLELDNGIPVAANGKVEVVNLVAPLIHRSSIGGFRAEFFTQEGGVMASVEDVDAVIDLAGSLQPTGDRSYQFIAQIAPKANTPANLREQMQFLGSANERGQYEMRLEWQL